MKKTVKYTGLFALAFLLFSAKVSAQQDTMFRFFKRINYPVASFEVGNLGELYLIDINNQLKKYDDKGDSIGVFNQVSKYGKLSYVEAQNPWKTILFYKNFSTIVLLDKYLKVQGSINLRNLNINKVQAVTTSYDNNIWLFDEQDGKIKKIDDSGNLLFESTDFRRLFDSMPTPEKMLDRDGFLYLYDSQKGMYIFDYYGSLKSKLSFPGWVNFTVSGKNIYGFDKEYLYKYTPPVPLAAKYLLPLEIQNNDEIKLKNQKMYVLKGNVLTVYLLK